MLPLLPFRFRVLVPMFVLMAALSGPLHAQAVTATPGEPQLTFRQIHMVSQSDGWAVVNVPDPDKGWNPNGNPDEIYAGTLTYILHTEDGGRTWANVTPPSTMTISWPTCDCADNGFAAAFFLDERHAWVVTDDAGLPHNQLYSGIRVWRTSDSGHSWKSSHDAMDSTVVTMVRFADPLHGWLLLGDMNFAPPPDLLYRTTDGGDTWQIVADDGVTPRHNSDAPISQPDAGIGAGFHTGMAFESGEVGWLTWSYIDPPNGGFLRTVDGGSTWAAVALPPDSPLADDQNGCGMLNLQAFAPTSITFQAYCVYGGSFLDHPQNDLYRSDDDGKTWQSFQLPQSPSGTRWSTTPQVTMTNATTGWMIGCELPDNIYSCDDVSAALTLYQTVDGAKTWTKLAPLPAHFVAMADTSGDLAFDFLDAQTGWAISQYGDLMTTTDGGQTWLTLLPAIDDLPTRD